MTVLPSAVLFYCRDFLSNEFPALARYIPTYKRVYIITKPSEELSVKKIDDKGYVFDLGAYIRETADEMVCRDNRFSQLHLMVTRDRYLRRMNSTQIAQVIHGLRRMLDDIAKSFLIEFYFDEPVSGFVNEAVSSWVSGQGGKCCHFQSTWLPGHMFFANDAGQTMPIQLGMIQDGKEKIKKHIELRLKGSAKPAYLHNYSSRIFTLKESMRFALLGINRKFRKSYIFIDADPWPHFFQARCLLHSVFAKYDSIANLKKLHKAKFVIFPLHYEPEAVIYYFSQFTNQLELASEIFDELPADTYLLLKEHPSQPGALHHFKWKELVANERVKVYKGTDKLADLLEFESAVISIASTAALEAAMLGRPAYVVGTPHFRNFPGVTSISNIKDLVIDWSQKPVSHDDMISWYGDFVNKNTAPLQIMRGRTTIPDPAALLNTIGLKTEGISR